MERENESEGWGKWEGRIRARDGGSGRGECERGMGEVGGVNESEGWGKWEG